MSREAFDPNAFKVEDIFRAKMARRQRLAKLPFEQKIEIVRKLQQVPIDMMRNEKLIFASFLEAYAELADEIVEWGVVEEWYPEHAIDPPPHPFDKRPDIIAVTKSGKKIGVELKSWVNREQIAEARKQERYQENIRKIIGEQGPNETHHIGQVWLSARQVRFDAGDVPDFQEQLRALIEREDKLELDQNSWKDINLDDFPTLERYLNTVRVHSRKRHRSKNWITFPYSASFFSPKTMHETLTNALIAHTKDERYNKELRTQASLDELGLLVHYDFKAFAYNTPFDAPNFGFEEAANLARETLNSNGGYFDRVFLFHF